MPRAGPAEKVLAGWNLNKQGGWKVFEEECENIAEKVEALIEDEWYSSDELIKMVDIIENKVKFKAIGKTRPRTEKAFEKKHHFS